MDIVVSTIELGLAFTGGWFTRRAFKMRHHHLWEVVERIETDSDYVVFIKRRCQLCTTEEVKKIG